MFCERPFALHRQPPKNHKQIVGVAPPSKVCTDAHACKLVPYAISLILDQ